MDTLACKLSVRSVLFPCVFALFVPRLLLSCARVPLVYPTASLRVALSQECNLLLASDRLILVFSGQLDPIMANDLIF